MSNHLEVFPATDTVRSVASVALSAIIMNRGPNTISDYDLFQIIYDVPGK